MINLFLFVLETEEDKTQFEKLYMKYKKKMYSIAYSILHNVEDSEDAVHQAFLTIADHFDKIKEISCQELPSYIVIIIKRTSINLYNKNKRAADIVMLSRWLLGSGDITDGAAGDLCADGVLDVYDLVAMRKLISE